MRWRERALAGRRDLRPVAVEALHVTLVFLGYLPEKEIGRVAETALGVLGAEPRAGSDADPPAARAASSHAVPRLSARSVRPVPPRNPRLFALDLEDEGDRATAVQAVLVEALAAARLHRPERRPFWPHVTLARVKRGERRVPALDSEPPPADPFEARTVTLYRSHLSPRGASYEALARLDLGA